MRIVWIVSSFVLNKESGQFHLWRQSLLNSDIHLCICMFKLFLCVCMKWENKKAFTSWSQPICLWVVNLRPKGHEALTINLQSITIEITCLHHNHTVRSHSPYTDRITDIYTLYSHHPSYVTSKYFPYYSNSVALSLVLYLRWCVCVCVCPCVGRRTD